MYLHEVVHTTRKPDNGTVPVGEMVFFGSAGAQWRLSSANTPLIGITVKHVANGPTDKTGLIIFEINSISELALFERTHLTPEQAQCVRLAIARLLAKSCPDAAALKS